MFEFFIDKQLVEELIKEQFPNWSHLKVKAVEHSGHDNRTFHLGDDMSVRLPSSEDYKEQVEKEQKWLPYIALHLSVEISKPIAMGHPSKGYPFKWSVYKWLEGKSANIVPENEIDFEKLALQLANFLNELHKIDTKDAPIAGEHNYWRGAHPSVYGDGALSYIKQLENIIDAKAANNLWDKAMQSKWEQDPVWVHGDFASGNILVKEKELAAVIDFGCMGVGDPACDLVISWTFLKGNARKIFKEHVGLDEDTWQRAKAWALWKAMFELCQIDDKNTGMALEKKRIIEEVLG